MTTVETSSTAPVRTRPPGIVREALRLRTTRVGLLITGALVALALLGPLFAPFGETEYAGLPNQRHVPKTALGTDYFGQDVVSRFLHGGRSILLLAVLSTVLGVGGGAAIGMLAAYRRGAFDETVMRVLDILLSFPQVLLALVVIAMFDPSPLVVVLTIGLSTIPRVARVIRGAALQVVERDFVQAAEALGESRRRIVFSEILPNVAGSVLVEANLRLTYSIGLIAALAFLGFTPKANSANWGLMIQENRGALNVQPWGVLLPTVAIALLTIGTGLVADGLSRVVAGMERSRAEV